MKSPRCNRLQVHASAMHKVQALRFIHCETQHFRAYAVVAPASQTLQATHSRAHQRMQPRLQGNTRVITLHLSQHARTVHDDKTSSTCNNKITFNKQASGVCPSPNAACGSAHMRSTAGRRWHAERQALRRE